MFISKKEIEIRYGETDQMGVVYHANYIVWLELGRTQFVHDLGYDFGEVEKDGYVSPVMNVNISYKAALRYGQKAFVHTWLQSQGKLRTVYGYKVTHEDGTVAATATTEHIVVKKESMRPVSFMKIRPEWYAKYIELAQQYVK